MSATVLEPVVAPILQQQQVPPSAPIIASALSSSASIFVPRNAPAPIIIEPKIIAAPQESGGVPSSSIAWPESGAVEEPLVAGQAEESLSSSSEQASIVRSTSSPFLALRAPSSPMPSGEQAAKPLTFGRPSSGSSTLPKVAPTLGFGFGVTATAGSDTGASSLVFRVPATALGTTASAAPAPVVTGSLFAPRPAAAGAPAPATNIFGFSSGTPITASTGSVGLGLGAVFGATAPKLFSQSDSSSAPVTAPPATKPVVTSFFGSSGGVSFGTLAKHSVDQAPLEAISETNDEQIGEIFGLDASGNNRAEDFEIPRQQSFASDRFDDAQGQTSPANVTDDQGSTHGGAEAPVSPGAPELGRPSTSAGSATVVTPNQPSRPVVLSVSIAANRIHVFSQSFYLGRSNSPTTLIATNAEIQWR
jgi:hypothetical protein